MRSRAHEVLLGHLCEVKAGPSGSLLGNLHDGSEGVPVISPPNLTDDHRVDPRRLRRVSWGEAERLARFALKAGDILVVRQGTLGLLALVEAEQTDWFYNSSCLRVRPDQNRILPRFLVAYLSHPSVQRFILDYSLPGTVPSLNSTMLNEVPVAVPPIGRQQEVVEALSDVDTRIRTQRQMADRLEALRPAIFGELVEGVECL
ncbi:restriction endonuclease subunit S [Streptomyces sp. NPDC054784]